MSDDELSTSLQEKLDISAAGSNNGRGMSRTVSSSRGRAPGSPKPSSLRTSVSPNPRAGGKNGGRGGGGQEKGGKGAGAGRGGGGGGGGGADDRSVMSSSGHGKRGGSGGAGGGGGGGGGGGAGGKGQRGESEDWTGGKGQQLAHSKMVHLFSHLPQYSKRASPGALSRHVSLSRPELHPAVVTLGLLYADGSVRGSNARTAAMLLAFKEVVQAYQPTPDKVLRLDLDKALKPHIQYLIDCRPHSIAMGNAIKWLRGQVHGLKREVQAEEARRTIVDAIETYITERITFAAETLARFAIEKITDGDVILVYGRSYSVELALKMAKEEGKDFRVVVADSRPLLEGRRLLETLSAAGIPTTYVNLNASSYVMRTVSKAFLGAAAMLSNGAVISRAGTAVVAMMARRFNIPAIFCCETYKFSDKVQLDSICWNEIGDPAELTRGTTTATAAGAAPSPPAAGGAPAGGAAAAAAAAATRQPKLLNIRYDLTPMKYVSLVITEVGMIPPTSVPVLIREYNKDDVVFDF